MTFAQRINSKTITLDSHSPERLSWYNLMTGVRILLILCLVSQVMALEDRVVQEAIDKAAAELELEDVRAMEAGARSKRSTYKKVTPE